MPIKVKSSETKDEFISRCMSVEQSSFPDEEQRYAVCNNYWENRTMTNQQKVLSKIKKNQKLIEPNPCQSGYIAIGTKIKDGRRVPNCVPED